MHGSTSNGLQFLQKSIPKKCGQVSTKRRGHQAHQRSWNVFMWSINVPTGMSFLRQTAQTSSRRFIKKSARRCTKLGQQQLACRASCSEFLEDSAWVTSVVPRCCCELTGSPTAHHEDDVDDNTDAVSPSRARRSEAGLTWGMIVDSSSSFSSASTAFTVVCVSALPDSASSSVEVAWRSRPARAASTSE